VRDPAFDPLSARSEGYLANPRLQAVPVVVHRAPTSGSPRQRNTFLGSGSSIRVRHGALLEVDHHRPAMIALVRRGVRKHILSPSSAGWISAATTASLSKSTPR
jgi:hypothetical protein